LARDELVDVLVDLADVCHDLIAESVGDDGDEDGQYDEEVVLPVISEVSLHLLSVLATEDPACSLRHKVVGDRARNSADNASTVASGS